MPNWVGASPGWARHRDDGAGMSGAPFFFGYGSLVNRRTHDYPELAPARVRGWRRVWRQTDRRALAFLSVHRVEDAEIDGLLAAVPGADWAALDLRESGYRRVAVPEEALHGLPRRPARVEIYHVADHLAGEATRPVPLSYLDCVVQGFLEVHGAEGARAFFTTTDGWDTPVLDDRAAPLYPRSVSTTRAERALVEQGLESVGARIIPPQEPQRRR